MELFYSLIDQLAAATAEERAKLEKEIWRLYGVERAVLVLDLSSFSLSTRRGALLDYLRIIRQMQLITRPLIDRRGGLVVKYEADNLMALFNDADAAIGAAVEIQRALAAARIPSVTAGGEIISASIGIDYGRLLLIGDTECIGDPVNMAYKLGEDLADKGEILLTDVAHRQLSQLPFQCSPQQLSISGVSLAAYRLEYSSEA